MIEWFSKLKWNDIALNKSSLILKILFQNTQKLWIFTINTNSEFIYKVIKNFKQQSLGWEIWKDIYNEY